MGDEATDPTEDLTPDLRRRLRILADTLPTLESPDFEPGHWHDSERQDDGVWTMPWYELSPSAETVLKAVGESGLMQPGFDWPKWAKTTEAIALRNDPNALAAATPDQLGKLLTALVREDRFNEGALGDTFESGFMAAIARRAETLADDVFAELRSREPIFHRPEHGTDRATFEAMMAPDYWEVGASGRIYDRAAILAELDRRYADPDYDPMEGLEVSDFSCRAAGEGTWLATYHLRQGDRDTRRVSVWRRQDDQWILLYHQGTVITTR